MNAETTALKGELKYKGNSAVIYDISYPVFSGSLAAGRINYRNKQAAQAKLRRTKTVIFDAAIRQSDMLKEEFKRLSVESSYQVMYDHNDIMSAFTDTYFDLGAEGTRIMRDCQTWDLKSGRIVQLKSIFVQGADFRKKLQSEIARQISLFEDEMGSPCYSDWQKKCMNVIDKGSFYLTDDGIAIYFPQGSISSNIWGIPTFLIEYKHLSGIISRRLL